MENIKIFISSSVVFTNQRDQIRKFFDTKNKIYQGKIFFETVVFEDFDNPVTQGGSQDSYNQAIHGCNYILLFFSNRVGKYTLEEFNVSVNDQITTYVYKLPDEIAANSRAEPDSVAQFTALLKEKDYFPEYADGIDNLLIKFYSNIERREIAKIIKDPVIIEQNFLSKKYLINRNDEIRAFERIAKTNPNSCTLFLYKGSKKDQPNYFNKRLEEKVNLKNPILRYDKFHYINLNEIFKKTQDAMEYIYLLADEINSKFLPELENYKFTTVGEFKAYFNNVLKENDIKHFILPFRVKGKIELENAAFVNDIVTFFKLFDFDHKNDQEVVLHFVINTEIDSLDETLFYKEIKRHFGINNYVSLEEINEEDIELWSESFYPNTLDQSRLNDKVLTYIASSGLTLPEPMAMIEEPLEKAITDLETK